MIRYAKRAAYSLAAFTFLATTPFLSAIEVNKIGLVNFKTCVEKSKIGKEEQGHFESLKKQMEGVLEEKEKALTELQNKFNDPDYLDSLSHDAEVELKHKFRTLSQELSQHQQQYLQILNQANMKIIQGLTEKANAAAAVVAKNKGLELVINDETAFFHNPNLDISNEVVKVLDTLYEQEQQEKKSNG